MIRSKTNDLARVPACLRVRWTLEVLLTVLLWTGAHPLAAAPGVPQQVLEALAQRWPDNRTVAIVCHGHSVPAGYFRTPEVRQLEAYPHLVREGLSRRFPHAVFNVIVTAIGGENAEQGAARFERDVLALRPDVVTLDYALNDRRIGLERAERAWRMMIEACRARDISVLLLTPTPDAKADFSNPADPLYQHAALVRRLATEHEVGLVDSLAAFQAETRSGRPLADLLAQSNHPNAAGHALVAAEILRWFSAAPASP